jgi:hypothetical protein
VLPWQGAANAFHIYVNEADSESEIVRELHPCARRSKAESPARRSKSY